MVLQKLDEAEEITLQKRLISWGDRWSVNVNGEQIAEVRGQPIYLIGDTYSMFSNNGNLVGSEGEAFRIALNEARLYDYNNEQTGVIRQRWTALFYNFDFLDMDGQTVGNLQQNFALTLNASITNPDGSCAFQISKALLSIGDRLTVARCGKSEIPAVDAVWMAMILNEIDASRSSSNSSSSSNS